MRPHFQEIIENLSLLKRLSEFDPVVIGTPPLGIDTGSSDIDIACSAPNPAIFSKTVVREFGHLEGFILRSVEHLHEPATVAAFLDSDWEIEIFCQKMKTEDQWGVRHFRIEQRLLTLEPGMRTEVLRLKHQGIKTEPAFAELLQLPGDPYAAMIDLEAKTETELREMLRPFSDNP